MPAFSFIIPVYNRIDEVHDLLESLLLQTYKDFEVIIVEDGSTEPCESECENAKEKGLNVKYIYKENEGRSIARNVGIENARSDYFIFVDSDCVIPPDYLEKVAKYLDANHLDCFGGPDEAHESFSQTQKSINFAMTSFLTTGGIRGGRKSLEKFTPRTFNMGFSRKVFNKTGGFREMFSEDIDMSKRIEAQGFSIGLIPDAYVWHKRRVNFKKFFRQVHVFGMSRITLKLLYPDSLKFVHALPAIAVILGTIIVLLGLFVNPWLFILPAIYFLAVFMMAYNKSGSLKVASLAVPASFIQIVGYGTGFIRAFFTKIILRKGRNIDDEIAIRKGK